MSDPSGRSILRHRLLLVALLAAHVWVKSRLVHLRLPPLSSDPCDAVGVYGILMVLVALFCCFASFFRRHRRPRLLANLYELRCQTAILVAICVTLIADAVALLRQMKLWTSIVSPGYLFALLGGLGALAIFAPYQIVVTDDTAPDIPMRWSRVALFLIADTTVLAVCPQWPTTDASQLMHLLTVAVGAGVLFLPLRQMILLLVPVPLEEARWGSLWEVATVAAGLACFGLGFWLHTTGGHVAHTLRSPLVILEAGGLLLGYGVAGNLLGMARESA